MSGPNGVENGLSIGIQPFVSPVEICASRVRPSFLYNQRFSNSLLIAPVICPWRIAWSWPTDYSTKWFSTRYCLCTLFYVNASVSVRLSGQSSPVIVSRSLTAFFVTVCNSGQTVHITCFTFFPVLIADVEPSTFLPCRLTLLMIRKSTGYLTRYFVRLPHPG